MNEYLIKIKNHIKGLHKARFISPRLHWQFLVKIFLGVSFILIIFSFYYLYKTKNQDINENTIDSSSSPVIIREKILEKVNQSFDEKEKRRVDIEATNILFSDPS